MKKIFALILFIFVLIFLLFSPKIASATVLFQDNFNDGNSYGWEEHSPHGSWSVINTGVGEFEYVGSATNLEPFQHSYSIAGKRSWQDYTFQVRIKGIQGVDKVILFRVDETGRSYGINLRSAYFGGGNDINLGKGGNYGGSGGVILKTAGYISYRDIWYTLRVDVKTIESGGVYIKVFVDNSLILEHTDTDDPIYNGAIGLVIWPGGYAIPSNNLTTTTRFDDVLVSSYGTIPTPSPTPSPPPTPSPTPTPLPKIVILPGLGASWNREKILFGTEVPQSAWKIPPWVPHYNNLIEALEEAGYQKNKDLFVFAYDWTKPVSLIADDLKNYIATVVNPPPGAKINLVGHSLGGLVGRAYIQKNPDNHKTDNLITLGSPHKGAPQVYKVWEGADLHELMMPPWRMAAELLLAVRGRDYQNKVQALRNLAPVLGNLLPIFDYLKWDRNNQIISESSLPAISRNLWLASLGVSPELLDLASTVVGTIGDTPRWLRLVPRDRIDEILGRWQIGKPVGQEYENGDRTVLASSAELSGANVVSLSLDHGGLVQSQEGIDKILELLGVEGTSLMTVQTTTETQTLVFALTSLDNLKITDPNGAIFTPEEDTIIVIPNPLAGNYKIEIVGLNPGSYRLLIGQLTPGGDVWSEYQGTTAPGETDTYNIPVDNTLITTPSYLLKLINEKLTKLISEIDSYNINLVTKAKIKVKLIKIFAELKPVPILLRLGKNDKADKFVQKAILTNSDLLKFTQEKGINSLLPPLRELQDLLGQLHDLL